MPGKITLIIGGCRSGKSSNALGKANGIPGENKIFIATSVPMDLEMEKRVNNHQKERGPSWKTEEIPVEIEASISTLSLKADCILVDCLTLWVSNCMMAGMDDDTIFAKTITLSTALKTSVCPVFLVTNEVGAGIVPDNALSRRFRDLAGYVNQKIAACADRVTWMVAGIPVDIKS